MYSFVVSIYTLVLELINIELTGVLLFTAFNQFLQNALLFIIGLELALTLIKHSFSNLIELLIFALIRKILVAPEATIETAIVIAGIIALILVKQLIKQEKISEDL